MLRETTYSHLTRAEAAVDAVELVMDEESFRGFYERNARSVWAYLARITGDRQVAEDLLQETFYRFLRASAVHESETHRRNSLYLIATNVARDARRRKAVRMPYSAGTEIERQTAGEAPRVTERSLDLARALSGLKPRERAMLWLAYAEGATHEEIASAVGVRPSSLKSLLFRARKKMAALLGGSR
jgi:RNA polymerase sigma-70 factor (ECF subfamily)